MIVVSPVSGLSNTVAAWTILTDFMVFYAPVYGATSHYLPVKWMTMQLDPQTIMSICKSSYILLYTTDPQTRADTFFFPYWKLEILRLSVEWILEILRNPLLFSVVHLIVMVRQLTK